MDLIEQSTAGMVAKGNHHTHQQVLGIIRKLPRNIYLAFNFCSSHHDGVILTHTIYNLRYTSVILEKAEALI